MAILTLSRKFNQWLGPFLLRHGLRARHAVLSGGGGGSGGGQSQQQQQQHLVATTTAGRDSPLVDALLGLPLAQWLVSLEIHDETRDAIQAGRKNVGVFDFWFHPKRDTNIKSKNAKRDSRNGDDGEHSRLLTLEEETEIRLHVLHKYLWPVLVGTKNKEQCFYWSNVEVWQFHHRFIQWVRREYFRAKYGSVLRATLEAFPALRQLPQLTSSSSSSNSSSSQMEPGMLNKVFSSWSFTSGNRKSAQVGPTTAAASRKSKSKLPSTSLVTMSLGMQDWSQRKNINAARDSMAQVAKRLGGTILEFHGGALCIPDIPKAAKLQYDTNSVNGTTASSAGKEQDNLLTMEDLLEVIGGHVATCGPLNALCEGAGIYQLWTREYVQALGEYLLQHTEKFHDQHGGETIVLDVGAGDGLLCEHLRDYFQELSSSASSLNKRSSASPRHRLGKSLKSRTTRISIRQPSYSPVAKTPAITIPTVIATDNGSWKVFPKADVEMLGYQESIEKYANLVDHANGHDDEGSIGTRTSKRRQVIVLCSWMPMNEDWSAAFRRHGVDEYILIGECDDGQCGDNWLTWGNPHFLSDDDGGNSIGNKSQQKQATPPYEVDGYVRKDLSDMHKFQFSRFDSSASKYGQTVSFRRLN
jgi:hypothetical protein